MSTLPLLVLVPSGAVVHVVAGAKAVREARAAPAGVLAAAPRAAAAVAYALGVVPVLGAPAAPSRGRGAEARGPRPADVAPLRAPAGASLGA